MVPPSPAALTHEEIWRRYDAVEARLTGAVSERMLDLAAICEGMWVLDLASGRGEPAIVAARRVGPSGRVVGVDLSEGLLAMARERAIREGLSNLDLRAGDAEILEGIPDRQFQAVTARWGLMYMRSPVAALTRARQALSPDGVLVAALWAEPEKVPYSTLPRDLLRRYRDVPVHDPEAPGTFRFADPARIHRDFALAGLSVDLLEEMETPVFESEDVEEVVEWVLAFGGSRLIEGLAESDRQAWENDLRAALESRRASGKIQLGGITRLARARPA